MFFDDTNLFQAWVEVQNERAQVVPGDHIVTARFVVMERATPLGRVQQQHGSQVEKVEGGGVVSAILHPSSLREPGDEEDPLSDNSTMLTAYSPFTGMHWSEYSLMILCGFILLVGIIAVGVYRGTRKAKYQMRHMSPQSYGDKRNAEDNALISGWMTAAVRRGLFGTPRRGHGEYKSIV